MEPWIQITLAIINLISASGGIIALVTVKASVQKAKAEARAVEIENMQKVIDSWKLLADERQEANADKDKLIVSLNGKIDELYQEIAHHREIETHQLEDITSLKITAATNALKLCQKPNCAQRTPPTGF